MTPIDYEEAFSFAQFELISRGFLPRQMDDKWFIFEENLTVFFHRSWSGELVFRVAFTPVDDGYTVAGAAVNTEVSNGENDSAFLSFLIHWLLLGEPACVPPRPTATAARQFRSLSGAPPPPIIHAPTPSVNLRLPGWMFIWPVTFSCFMVVFMGAVALRRTSPLDLEQILLSGLVAILFIAPPIGFVLTMIRTSTSSVGTNLRMRLGVCTRSIPAADIQEFTVAGYFGRRPAVLTWPGSPTHLLDSAAGRPTWHRWLRRVWTQTMHRSVGLFLVPGVPESLFSNRRCEVAMAELDAWLRWARQQDAANEPPPNP